MVTNWDVKLVEMLRMMDFKFFSCHHNMFDAKPDEKGFVFGDFFIPDVDVIDDFLDV